MSLILDALRKSEGQRQKHVGPALATVPEARQASGTPRWTVILGVLLALNAVVVTVLLLTRPSDDGAGPSAGTAQPPPAQVPAEPAIPQNTRAPGPQAPAAQQRVALPPPNRAARQEVRPLSSEMPPPTPRAAPPPASRTATGSQPAARTPPPSGTAGADARLPRMAELVVAGELNVPDMHVDIHVYSGNPAQRFVFINMRKYVEGDVTREGPSIERITETGVVMRHNGRRFVLPKD